MAFSHRGTLTPYGAPVKVAVVAKNSEVITELDSLKIASNFILRGTAGASVYGHAIALRTKEGVGFETTGVAGAATGSFVGTYTFASDNQTVGMAKVELDVSRESLYSGELDAAIGTTTGSDLRGYFIDLIDEDTLDENTAATTVAQYATHGTDSDNTAQAVVSIHESGLFGPLSA